MIDLNMLKEMLKIHISSIKAVTEDTFTDVVGDFAVINCAERKNHFLTANPPALLLQLSFADITNENDPNCFSLEHGKEIRAFYESLPPSVTDLFIFCDAGESRSTAIAAAILLAGGRSDAPVWSNPFYHPNTFVFGRLCQAFGMKMTEAQIAEKKRQSEDAFRSTIKNGTHFQRWEVISADEC